MLKNLRIYKVFLVILWLAIGIFASEFDTDRDRVIFLDVGQGDSILIQNDDFEVLIDGGPDDSVVYKMGKYMKWNDRVIDVVVITHMHDDHYRGIKYLMERYDIGVILFSVNCGELCDEFKVGKYIEVSEGMSLKYGGIDIDILWPRVGVLDENLNNDSVVMLLNYLDKKILLMGDAEEEVEEIILRDYRSILTDIDILKAGHHCSNTASTYDFLEIVNPDIAICSCGEENSFGHPHKETIDNFDKLDIEYYVTWEHSDYVVK
jgi:competence protein ComEC